MIIIKGQLHIVTSQKANLDDNKINVYTPCLVNLVFAYNLTWSAPVWHAAQPVREWQVPSIKREKAIYMVRQLKSEEISQEENKGGSYGKLACKQKETVLNARLRPFSKETT